jgi:hypothetical protein
MDEIRRVKCGMDEAVEKIKKTYGGGNISVCYTGDAPFEYVRAFVIKLARAGFIITERAFDGEFKKNVEDYLVPIEAVRLIIAIGGGLFADVAAAAAYSKKIKAIFIPTCFYSEGRRLANFFCGGGIESRRLAPFELVITDEELIKKAGEKIKAGALGVFLADALGAFDKICGDLIFKGELSDGQFDGVLQNYRSCFSDMTALSCPHTYGCALISASAYRRLNPNLSVEEAAFIIAYALIKLYKRFLESAEYDLCAPKDYGRWCEILTKKYGADAVMLFKKLEPHNAGTYLKRRHIIAEYRTELLSLINKLDALSPIFLKRFRRMYTDAGFFIKDAVKGRDVFEAIALGASLTDDYSLARQMDDGGLFDIWTNSVG